MTPAADLSVAMGSGSNIATDVAQGHLGEGGSPYALRAVHNATRLPVRIIHQNFFWAFLYNLIAVPIAAGIFYPRSLPLTNDLAFALWPVALFVWCSILSVFIAYV